MWPNIESLERSNEGRLYPEIRARNWRVVGEARLVPGVAVF